jgi:hypothetical protein
MEEIMTFREQIEGMISDIDAMDKAVEEKYRKQFMSGKINTNLLMGMAHLKDAKGALKLASEMFDGDEGMTKAGGDRDGDTDA